MTMKSLFYHKFEVCRVLSTNYGFTFTCMLACTDYNELVHPLSHILLS